MGEKMINKEYRGTTVLALVDKRGAAMGADGQVSLGDTIMKAKASKIRRLYNGSILAGFAGASADALIFRESFPGGGGVSQGMENRQVSSPPGSDNGGDR
jgi:ATP-dependent HslUV protease subunit HslV